MRKWWSIEPSQVGPVRSLLRYSGGRTMRGIRLAVLTFVFGATFTLAGVAPKASAAFPGTNGKIVFQSDRSGSDYDIVRMGENGGNETQLTTNALDEGGASWSADGTTIIFARIPSGEADWELYTMDSDGLNVTRLTTNSVYDNDAVWSPDDSEIAFIRDIDDEPELMTMNADGTGVTQLTDDNLVEEYPVWSPDGTKIAYSGTDTGGTTSRIFVMDADGTDIVALTGGTNDTYEPDWSPDGTQIAYCRLGVSRYAIWTMDADGTDKTAFTDPTTQDDCDPVWSPDGTAIAFTRYTGNFVGELYRKPVTGGSLTRLTDNSDDDWLPDWQAT
jgi:TolB protein